MSSPWKEEQEATPRTNAPLSIEALTEDLRLFNRSPHPYHRSRRLGSCTPSEHGDRLQPVSSYSRSSRTTSDSGTEADDESTGILRGLPAPPLRPRKGLRLGPADLDDWLPSLQPWPSFERPMLRTSRRSSEEEIEEEAFEERLRFRRQRRVEVLRRLLEAALLLSVGGVVLYQDGARSLAWEWRKGMCETDIPTREMEIANFFLQKLLLIASWSRVSMPPIRSLYVHRRAEAGASGASGLRNGHTSQYPRASIQLPFSILSLSRYSFRCRCPTILRHLSCPISSSAYPLYQWLLYRSRTGPMYSISSIG